MKKTFTIILFALFALSSYSQQLNYKQKSKEENSNYFKIVKETRAELSKQDKSKLANKKAEKQFERWAYYWENRVYSDGSFPNANLGFFNAGILNAKGQLDNADKNQSVQSELTWVNIGTQGNPDANDYPNYPQIGRLNCFLRFPHPSNQSEDVLFVGAPTGGVWKSSDNGTNWMPILDNVAGIGVTDIKSASTDYSSNTVIYVSTGDYDSDQLKSIGVLKSTDGGATFQSTNLSFSINEQKALSNLVVISDDIVIVGSNHHIYKTTDGGNIWNSKFSDTSNDKQFGRFISNGNKIWCMSSYGDVYYSSNSGDNWTSIKTGPGPYNKNVLFIKDDVLSMIDSDGQLSHYNGSNWINDGNPVPEYDPQGGYNQAMIIENNMIISGAMGGYHTTDNANTWYQSLNGYWQDETSDGSYIHSDFHSMGLLDDNTSTYKYWACNDGGLNYIEYANENTLKPIITYKSEKCIVTQLYSVAITPNSTEGNMIQGNQDNDGFSREMHNGAMQWIAVMAGDGTATAIDYTNPNIRFLGGTTGALTIALNGFSGNYYGDLDLSIPNANFVWPLEINTLDHNKLYAGGDDVYLINMEITPSPSVTALNANTGAVSFISTHNNSIFAVGENAIRKSLNAGQSWTSINQASTNPSASINSIDFSGSNTNKVYATCSSYIDGEKVYKSEDGGQTWTNISSGIPNIYVIEILLLQNNEQEILYLATELGVYYRIGNNNWAKLGDNTFPNVIVNDIDINYTERSLVAATFGRGLWQVDISSQLTNVTDMQLQTKVSIYPNPASHFVNVDFSVDGEYHFCIYNVVGGIIKEGKLSEKHNSIYLNELSKGSYMLKIFDNKYSYTQKLIKK